MSEAFPHLTVAEAAGRIARGELSPVALTRACLERIAALDGRLNAFLLVLEREALAAAEAAEAEIAAGRHRGPLHGIPYALKDIYDTAGIRTTGHSKITETRVPERDAETARRLREAGGILLGKLATHEYAYGGPSFDLPWPPARNPWDTDRFTGGSSSGAGAAVAAGLALFALGSDTGGSIRHPAAQCGLAGLKPTFGRVSRVGVLPLAYSHDTCGPMTWTVEDCALVLQALAGHDPADPQSADVPVPDYAAALTGDVRGLKVGLVRHFYTEDRAVHPAQQAAVEAAAETLAGLGAAVEEVRLSPLADYTGPSWVITCAEAGAVHEENLRTRLGDYGENFRYRVLPGALLSGVDYVQAQRQRRALVAEMAAVLERVHLLLTVTVPTPPQRFEEVTLDSLLASRPITSAFNMTGFPALAVRAGFTPEGLPLSVTLAGRPFDEATVLRAGHAYEQAPPWRDRRPAL